MDEGHRALASAVIGQAVKDIERPEKFQTPGHFMRWQHRSFQALQFLGRRNVDLEFWCAVAGVSVSAVVRRYARDLRRREAIGA